MQYTNTPKKQLTIYSFRSKC